MKNVTIVLYLSLMTSPAFAGGGDFWFTTGLHAVNLLILIYLLVRGAGPKIREVMAERSRQVGQEIIDAEARFVTAEEKLKTYEARLEALGAEASKMLEEYTELGKREAQRLRDDAARDAERILAEAKQLAARELNAARASIEKDLVVEALDKAEAQIRVQLTMEDKQRLVSGYFAELESSVKGALGGAVNREAS